MFRLIIIITLIIQFCQNSPAEKTKAKPTMKTTPKSSMISLSKNTPRITPKNAPKPMDILDDYHRYDQIKNYQDEKAKIYPTMVKVSSIGKTVERREIQVLKMGEKLGSKDKKIIYIDGGLHAREKFLY